MVAWIWQLWRSIWQTLFHEPEDESEHGPVEAAFQIGCLIVALVVAVVAAATWLSR
jgi:hypothetical protein